MKDRLDKLLVSQGLAPSREKAQALILAGLVRVNGAPVTKAGTPVQSDAELLVKGADHPYVSRGGVKLEAGLRAFALDVTGLAALDIGASTGGFTHCLLLHGARRVFAVDVGYGQLAWELRQDPRVVTLERTNIRHLVASALDEPVDLVVVDVSFISLGLVLEHGLRFLRPGGQVLALVKPQFEAGKAQVGRGGRVRDPEVHQQVLDGIAAEAARLGMRLRGQVESPLPGKKSGNLEFLVLLQHDPALPATPAAAPAIEATTDATTVEGE